MWSTEASHGACCPTRTPNGRVSLGTSAHGVPAGTGSGSMIPCAPRSATRKAVTRIPPRGRGTAKASRPPHWGESAATRVGQKGKGRQRPRLVATLGRLLAVVVTAASVSDPAGARLLLARLGGACTKLRLLWGDGT